MLHFSSSDVDKLGWQTSLFIGVFVAGIFIILAATNITAQGLFYDELHQVPASFAYTGGKPTMFAKMLGKVPVLNMPYSAAIKSAIYGVYLRVFDASFTIKSWRLFGLLIVAIGIIIFSFMSRVGMTIAGLIIFFLLFLSDITVLLATRHDWGPVALALLIRLIFLAIVIHYQSRHPIPSHYTFFLGCLVGIAAFEKLSSIVLIFPFVLILALQKQEKKRWLAGLKGLFVGFIPLIALNAGTFLKKGMLVSLKGAIRGQEFSFSDIVYFLNDYLALGHGERVQKFILGHGGSISSFIERVFLFLLIIFILVMNIQFWKRNRHAHLSGVMLLSYMAVAVGLYLLPRYAWIHHWIIGTPFQYLAISLAAINIVQLSFLYKKIPKKIIQWSFFVLVASFMIFRINGIISLEKSLMRGDASITWDPSFTQIGVFAASHAQEALFLAANWGVATQIYCLSNGKSNLIYEPFWNYRDINDLVEIIQESGKKVVYLVSKIPDIHNLENTRRIQNDIEKIPGWIERPVEKEIAELKAVKARKFIPLETHRFLFIED